jgi:predicted nucleotidyltransferase
MILFGSQARGEAAKDSDIDVLVVLKGNVNPGEEIKRTSLMVAELSLEYNQVISRLFVDESRFNSYNSPLLQNIRREGIAF